MALGPAQMDAAVLANLESKTGKGLDHWIDLLDREGPFAKPSVGVAWLKAEHGLGHVTAQIIMRKWASRGREAPAGDPVETVLGAEGAKLLRILHAALAADLPQAEILPRKAYVGLSAPVQFAVAVRPRRPGATIWLALVAQDPTQAPLAIAPRLGGSDRFTLLLEVGPQSDRAGVLAHLRAAAGL